MFKEPLKKIVDNTEGGIAGVLMGFDGIEVESYTREGGGQKIDISTVAMEMSVVLKHATNAAEILEIGKLQEFSFQAEQLIMVVRLISDEYFMGIAMEPDGNFGKARFLMRVTLPKLRSELG